MEDRFSVPIAKRNLRRASGITVRESDGILVLTAALKGAAIWGWDLEGIPAGSQAGAGTPVSTWLKDVMDRRIQPNPTRDMVLTAADGDSGYRWAAFHTSDEDLELDVDPRPLSRSETLARLNKLDSSAGNYNGRLLNEELLSQPIGRSWWDPVSIEFQSVDTDIQLLNDRDEHAVITSRTRLETLRDGLRVLSLSLRSDWPGPGRRRGLHVEKLTVDGQAAPYVRHYGSLLVQLPSASRKGQSFLLEVVSEGDVLERPSGDNYWQLLGGWYPRPIGGGQEWSGFQISVEARPPFVPFASGEIVERANSAGGNRVVTKLKGPMEGASVLAGKYSEVTDDAQGARIHVSTYASAKVAEAHKLARIMHAVRGCLESWLGAPYPFQDLEVLEINDWGFGMAPPGMIFITQEAFFTAARAEIEKTNDLARATSRGVNERVAHEVAHGWFPHVMKIVSSEESWLSESFADYTSAVCLELVDGDKGHGRFLWQRQLTEWKDYAKEADDGTSIYLAEHLGNGEKDRRTRQRLLYGKGPLVLHALRQELARGAGGEAAGDRLFFTWMKSLVRNFTYKAVGTRHLVAILNQMTGKDWQPWFERYVYGTETPPVK